MTDSQHSFAVSPPAVSRQANRQSAGRQDEADGPFLRRILIGLVAATVLSGAVTLTLITQHELVEGMQVASTHGPA
jgi:hypothetical protein